MFLSFGPDLKLEQQKQQQQQEKSSCFWNTEGLYIIIIMHEPVVGKVTVLL